MPRSTSRNDDNAVSRTIYCSIAQDARHKKVAKESFGGNASAALVARFDDVENLFDIPAYLKPRIVGAATAAGLTMRDYVIKVFTEHALALPAQDGEKSDGRRK